MQSVAAGGRSPRRRRVGGSGDRALRERSGNVPAPTADFLHGIATHGRGYNAPMDLGRSLANHLLIAVPAMDDPNFARGVTLLCQHDDDGAMGVLVNRLSDYTLGDVLRQMNIVHDSAALAAQPVLQGGPVHPERGFVLHDDPRDWDSTLRIAPGLAMTTSRDILEAMARGDGPANAIVALGCAGWQAGQLESELTQNTWLTVSADPELLFALPLETRWLAAAQRIGVDLHRLTDYAGHA